MQTQAETSSTSRRLPDRWVAKIFQDMQGNYGSRFLNQWKTGQSLPDGTDAGVRNAMNTWANKLGGFTDCPSVFATVLANLPAEPPSLPQFHESCRIAMKGEQDRQTKIEYKLSPEDIERNRQMAEKAKQATQALGNKDPLEWARNPRSRLAFAEVLKLAKTDARFAEIVADLVRDGITDGQKLLKHWNGAEWFKA